MDTTRQVSERHIRQILDALPHMKIDLTSTVVNEYADDMEIRPDKESTVYLMWLAETILQRDRMWESVDRIFGYAIDL